MEENKKPGRPKKATTATIENADKKMEQKIVEKKIKTRLMLNDADELLVRSNVFGKLIYINDRIGTETEWDESGEIQSLSVKDIKDMKAKQQAFFKNEWITIVEYPDIDENHDIKDVYDALQLGKYYKENELYDSVDDIFDMNEEKIRKCVNDMSESVKLTLIVRANDKIEDGTLDSIKKVKLLEEILGCELASPTE